MAFNFQQYNTQYLLNINNNGAPINDAADKYGVKIVAAADVADGETYWRVIGVHHLLPRENFSEHNVFLEVLDEQGVRIKKPQIWAGWTWEGRQPNQPANPVPLDKPDNEPIGNIPMFFGQIVSVWIDGDSPTAQDKSDRVEGLSTDHPDEPLPDGTVLNSVGHHSFYVVFQRTRKSAGPSSGIIQGRVEGGQGQIVRLLQNNTVVAEQTLNKTLQFQFDYLPFGVYRLEIVNTTVSQDNIKLDAANPVQTVNLVIPPPDNSAIYGQVQNGQGKILLLVKDNNIIARVTLPGSGQYRFDNLAAGNYALVVFETDVRQDNIALDGTNTREVNLVVPPTPQTTKTINHYLLFGPPNSRGRQTTLLLAVDYILAFSVTVGFSVDEAKQARQVTIVGADISPADQQAIKDSGSQVEVINSDVYNIEATFKARVQSGQEFGS